jgi:hypothetical protein
MQINPPYAYKDIVPLDKAHRVHVPGEREVPAAFQAVNAVPLSFTEFPRASRDYPVVFISGDSGKSFVAMIALGLERAGEQRRTVARAAGKGSESSGAAHRGGRCVDVHSLP